MNKELQIKKEYDNLYVRKNGFSEDFQVEKNRDDTFNPPLMEGKNYKKCVATDDEKTCLTCISYDGRIFPKDEIVRPHINCRCIAESVSSIYAGEASKDGKRGADFWIFHYSVLPAYYVSREEAEDSGWSVGDSPVKYIPGKMITMGIYKNEDKRLPHKTGRVWYEADINYYSGKRNKHRVLWSNDGLVFVTYDHYVTFYEII